MYTPRMGRLCMSEVSALQLRLQALQWNLRQQLKKKGLGRGEADRRWNGTESTTSGPLSRVRVTFENPGDGIRKAVPVTEHGGDHALRTVPYRTRAGTVNVGAPDQSQSATDGNELGVKLSNGVATPGFLGHCSLGQAAMDWEKDRRLQTPRRFEHGQTRTPRAGQKTISRY
ncbi:hypothetical protein EV356DRAFT_517621 [Viridothelium virens]|uniref:Uncharacterized protein n=1 Tax=Viridothelium virens TaxID=1048519 RepID=A0A6A6H3L5_VIRVR|nr:hypothetical protein EV356DRAFT_517621 [Viridothelium virens]